MRHIDGFVVCAIAELAADQRVERAFVSSGGGVCVSKAKIEAARAGRRVVSTTARAQRSACNAWLGCSRRISV